MKGNIMIVDDSPVDRKILRHALEKTLQGINLFEVENGLEIAEKLARNNIHVCILDILLPCKDGYQVLEEIKADPRFMDLPVIVYTGKDDQQAIKRALTLGAYDFFTKPSEAIPINARLISVLEAYE